MLLASLEKLEIFLQALLLIVTLELSTFRAINAVLKKIEF